MASVSVVERGGAQNLEYSLFDVTLSASYAAGGESVASLPDGIKLVLVEQPSGYHVQYDRASNKIKVFRDPAHTHTENTAATYTQNAATAASVAGQMAEVSAGVDLSAVTVRLVILHRR